MPMPSYGYYTIRKKYFFSQHTVPTMRQNPEGIGEKVLLEGNFLVIQENDGLFPRPGNFPS
jgi:hypothetical protein